MDVTFSERLRVHSELVYTRKGSGEPLVLIHGIGHRRQAWDPVFERLAESYDVIAVDLAGFGESPAYPYGVGYNMPSAPGPSPHPVIASSACIGHWPHVTQPPQSQPWHPT